MIKTIKIGSKSLKLSNNLAWALTYKNQFGHDIVPDVMPIVSALSKLIGEMMGNVETVEDIFTKIDGDLLREAMIELCAFQFVDFINLVWAFNKTADEEIPEPKEWVKQFDTFPIDEIGPAVYELLMKGLISTKNLKSLREATAPKATEK